MINDLRGKYVKKGSYEPVGVCDRSGFWFSISDLCKQMEWKGKKLVWTGLMVGRPFLDVPDEVQRTVTPRKDPTIVKNPRPLGDQDAPSDYSLDGIPSETIRINILPIINFTQEEIVPELPNMAGEDISKETSEERLIRLKRISWNE